MRGEKRDFKFERRREIQNLKKKLERGGRSREKEREDPSLEDLRLGTARNDPFLGCCIFEVRNRIFFSVLF